MIRRAAILLCEAAAWLLPPGREAWGAAMRIEVLHISCGRSAFAFGFGCIRASVRERLVQPESRSAAARWSVAFATFAFALFHLGCAMHGTSIMAGADDPYYRTLMAGGPAERAIAEAYRAVTPLVAVLLWALGLALLAGVLSLLKAAPKSFAASGLAALLAATSLAIVIVRATGEARGVAVLFGAVALQALMLPMLFRSSAARGASTT